MKLLLDTHTYLRFLMEPKRIPSRATRALLDRGNEYSLSLASLWEMTIKASKGNLRLPAVDVAAFLDDLESWSIHILEMEALDLVVLESLPPLHKDPFDRIIVSQAIRHGMTLVTVDSLLSDYGVPVLWA